KKSCYNCGSTDHLAANCTSMQHGIHCKKNHQTRSCPDKPRISSSNVVPANPAPKVAPANGIKITYSQALAQNPVPAVPVIQKKPTSSIGVQAVRTTEIGIQCNMEPTEEAKSPAMQCAQEESQENSIMGLVIKLMTMLRKD